MLVQRDKEDVYFNFVNSINSDVTRKNYEYCMSRFLKYCNLDLDALLKLPQQELSNLIIKYLVSQKISSQYKTVIMATIKHACEMNDVILNWKKLKKFIRSEKTDNEINGKDRGYTHEEIQKILEFSDQRLKTAFLVLASTGIRIGALQSIKLGDLERINNLYKITVYRGDKEEYITFCTPECAKEIDAYLDFRQRRGDRVSYRIAFLFTAAYDSVIHSGIYLEFSPKVQIELTNFYSAIKLRNETIEKLSRYYDTFFMNDKSEERRNRWDSDRTTFEIGITDHEKYIKQRLDAIEKLMDEEIT